MKYYYIFISILLLGCSPVPTPEVAVKACIDKGWVPIYNSNGGSGIIHFECKPHVSKE